VRTSWTLAGRENTFGQKLGEFQSEKKTFKKTGQNILKEEVSLQAAVFIADLSLGSAG